MGFDVSFHPLDSHLLYKRLGPYVTGAGEGIDDLVEDAVRISRVRHIAHAVGVAASKSSPPPTFEPFRHIWGRPFLVTGKRPSEVAEGIDSYLRCDPAEAESLARTMLDGLDQGFGLRVKMAPIEIPSDDLLRDSIRQRIDFMRDAVQALRKKTPTVEFDGQAFAPSDIVGSQLPFILLEFMSHLRPGFMSRGHVWPSLRLAGSSIEEQFGGNISLAIDIYDEFGETIAWRYAHTIETNYMVGGVLPLDCMKEARDEIVKLGEPEMDGTLLEAIDDCLFRYQAMVEATEIYSGIEGIVN